MNMTSVVCSAILCAGLLGTGYFAVNNYSMRHNLVEVKGVAEKKVKSDVCVMTVKLKSVADDPKTVSQNCDRDKEKLLVALKNGGLQDHEISNVNSVYYKRDKYKDGKSTGEEEYHINESLSFSASSFAISNSFIVSFERYNCCVGAGLLKVGLLFIKDIRASLKLGLSSFNSLK